MSETDDTIAAARATLDRRHNVPVMIGKVPVMLPVGGKRMRVRRGDTLGFRLAAIGVVNAIILLCAAVVGFIAPIGLFGALAVLMLMIATTLAIAFAPAARAPSVEELRALPVRHVAQRTGRWLDAQRPALPAPAATLADEIGIKLAQLEPQLATLDPETPAATEIRKLVAEQLPDFVKGYQAVPPSLRTQPRNGQTPDAQLVDGLKVIDQQLADMTAQLAQGDLDNLATRGRYLQIRYQGDDS